MTSLSKALLVNKLDERGLGYSKEELHECVNAFIGILSQSMIDGEEIRLSKFGNFIV